MNKAEALSKLRRKLSEGRVSLGSWMQIPHSSVAEIMGAAGYDWVAVDLEHGSIAVDQLPDLFRALELGSTLPLARLAQGASKDCKQALDAGAAGVIVPMIENAEQLRHIRDCCCWPPAGRRGVGFSRANLFGEHFDDYRAFAQAPLLIAMIEHIAAVDNLARILEVPGLDAILVGPYDLSASMGCTGRFDDADFLEALARIRRAAAATHIASGVHVVAPSPSVLQQRISEGHRFIAYSLDAAMLVNAARDPLAEN